MTTICLRVPPAPAYSSPWSGVMYLLEGRLTALVGDASYGVEPGGLVFFPDRPMEESIADILSVTQRHGVALARA